LKYFTYVGNSIKEFAKQITEDDGKGPRLYQTPNGDIYPSITEVLSVISEEHIQKWKERVGEKRAKKECEYALDRGNEIHKIAELYLLNKPIDLTAFKLNSIMFFNQLKRYVELIDNIQAQETPLFSDYFRLAGRCDCIAEYKGVLSVVDFKGAKRAKTKDVIEAYFYQTAFYAYAYYEPTGIKIPQTVILMANEDGGSQAFIEKPYPWWKNLKEIRKLWQLKHPEIQ